MNIGIIGCGEVGYLYSVALADAEYSLQICAPRPSDKVHKFVTEKQNICLHRTISFWLENVDIVIACTPGAVSLNVAKEAIPFMKKGALYADFSSSAPSDKRASAALAELQEIYFIDIVIMGSVDLTGVCTPLLCAGNGAEKIGMIMERLNVPMRILPNAVAGDAASLKLLRTVFMKGLSALTVECIVTAEYQGVKQLLYEILSDFDQTPLSEFLDMLLRNHVIHACRQRYEIAAAIKQLQSLELPIQLLPSVETLFATTCASIKSDPIKKSNPTTEDALAWLIAMRCKKT